MEEDYFWGGGGHFFERFMGWMGVMCGWRSGVLWFYGMEWEGVGVLEQVDGGVNGAQS